MSVIEVDARNLAPALLHPPPSKSDAERALVLGLASFPKDASIPSDVRVLEAGLERLKTGGAGPIDCADGGAPFRFLLGQAAITPGHHVLTGTPRLGQRPRRALIDALSTTLGPAGLVIREGNPWPVEVTGVSTTGEPCFRIDASKSSQFASSLLLAAAALHRRERRAWTVELTGPSASAGYLDLTLDWLRRAGYAVSASGPRLSLSGWREPTVAPRVPGDWSGLGYLLLIAWRSKGTVGEIGIDAPHPDRAIVGVLEEIGLRVELEAGAVSGTPARALSRSIADCPDLGPTLAALACVLPGPSRLTEVAILRSKESDRLAGCERLIRAAGGSCQVDGDALSITPPQRPRAAIEVRSAGDHRMAMAGATLACLLGVTARITEPDCVSKSFPGFWTELARSGVVLRR